MKIESLRPGTSQEISCLACGIGDARNLLKAILCVEIYQSYGLSSGVRSQVDLHFTLVDLKPAVFARILIVFRLLFDADAESKAGKAQIYMTLSYIYTAQVVPKWAFDKLQGCISTILADLADSSHNVMSIFYIAEPTRERISYVLRQWQQTPQP